MTNVPAHLRDSGGAFYGAVLHQYGLDDDASLALLQAASEALDRIAAARAVIERDGEVILDRYGQPKVHPACALERDSRNSFLSAMRLLGLDPNPRGRGNPGIGGIGWSNT